jgi:hypothetical protein
VAHGEGTRPRSARLGLAQILSAHPPDAAALSKDQARVVRDLVACRTAALGGHLQKCDCCEVESPLYNSCLNRHCPGCQSVDQALWVEAQVRALLPVLYFHLVFTIPPALHPFFRRQPGRAYALLFRAASQALLQLAHGRLGATPAVIALLHTWTQVLLFHPHLHLIVTGGGVSLDGQRWIATRPNFFLSVRALSKLFRGKLLAAFEQALVSGELHLSEQVGRMLLRQAAAKAWVVYSKPPITGPEQALRYLGRYTHRIAIGNERLVALRDGNVTFRYRDRRRKNRRRELTLEAPQFIRRFLLHVVPRHFVRVRYYGLLANRVRKQCLARARSLLNAPQPPEPQARESRIDVVRRLTGIDPTLCPVCKHGHLHVVARLEPQPSHTARSP